MAERSAVEPTDALYRRSLKRRPRAEILCEYAFRPVAHAVVRPLAALRVPPPALVVAHTAIGVLAAVLVARGHLVEPALLLQLKTVLDNADGQLARATGRVSELGRYLDTEGDWVVNGALFAALAVVTGEPLLAAGAAVALMVTLSIDFNLEHLYRTERGERLHRAGDVGPAGVALRIARGLYTVTLGWQDRLVRAGAERHVGRLAARARDEAGRARVRRAYHDPGSLLALVNLGLSTQLAVLGLCLVLGAPEAYLWFALASLAVPVVVVVRRHVLGWRAA